MAGGVLRNDLGNGTAPVATTHDGNPLLAGRCAGGRQLHDGARWLALEGDLVHCGEEREAIAELVLLHDRPDLLGGEGALELLAAEELALYLFPGLLATCPDKGLGALAIP